MYTRADFCVYARPSSNGHAECPYLCDKSCREALESFKEYLRNQQKTKCSSTRNININKSTKRR